MSFLLLKKIKEKCLAIHFGIEWAINIVHSKFEIEVEKKNYYKNRASEMSSRYKTNDIIGNILYSTSSFRYIIKICSYLLLIAITKVNTTLTSLRLVREEVSGVVGVRGSSLEFNR